MVVSIILSSLSKANKSTRRVRKYSWDIGHSLLLFPPQLTVNCFVQYYAYLQRDSLTNYLVKCTCYKMFIIFNLCHWFTDVRIELRKPSWPWTFTRSTPVNSAARQRASPACWARPSPPSIYSTSVWALPSTWSLSLKTHLIHLRLSPSSVMTLSSGKIQVGTPPLADGLASSSLPLTEGIWENCYVFVSHMFHL